MTWFRQDGHDQTSRCCKPPPRMPLRRWARSKSLGSIAPGYFADIVAVKGDPLADIQVVLKDVQWVMKGGAL